LENPRSRRFFLSLFLTGCLLAAAPGCTDSPPPKENGGNGHAGENPAIAENGAPATTGSVGGTDTTQDPKDTDWTDTSSDIFGDIAIFFGGDRPPSRALKVIREVHDLKDWSYRMNVPNAVEQCRDAVRDLARSDYASWDESGLVVSVVSQMLSRDPSALVRSDCVTALLWFHGWVHPDAKKMGKGVASPMEDVNRALTALAELPKGQAGVANPSNRLVCIDAVSILGSHPWDDIRSPDPSVVRTSLARPRGITRRLTARDLTGYRKVPEVRDTLDRALLRLSDQVIFMSLVGALADGSSHVRSAAVAALTRAGRSRAVPPLIHTLEKEEHEFVRTAIVEAITDLAEYSETPMPEAVVALAAELTDPDLSVRYAAARGLTRLTGESPGGDPTDWIRWWQENGAEYQPR